MHTSPRYYDLLEALPEQGCPICRLIIRDRDRYLSSILYEYVNKHETNQAFRDGRGLCNSHMHLLMNRPGNSLGIALLNHAVMDELLAITDKSVQGNVSGLGRLLGLSPDQHHSLAETISPVGPCLLCERMDATERSLLDVLSQIANDTRLRAAFANSPGGLCVPHTRIALQEFADAAVFWSLQRVHWQQLHAELQTFIEKNNRSIEQEDFGAEGDSWRRAIHYIAGEDGIFRLRRSPSK